ncbi:MAG: hypothetical protein DI547_05005 [Sphingobium sp.]|nr:MAG: hypothetical protein DI547_05005 [Sphingobium sp.]
MTKKPSLGIRLFDGDFSSAVDAGQASFEISSFALERIDPLVERYVWAGAPIRLYAGNSGDAWPWPEVFKGRIDSFQFKDGRIALTAKVDSEPFEAQANPLLYAGTTGIEGGADLKNRPKPWAFGAPRNVEPVLIDSVNSVFQVSGYGPIKAVDALYERGSAFGASLGDAGSYSALVASDIPAGRWGTCLAQGLIRLGAPPYGVITADVQGDYAGAVWRRLPGAIIRRVCDNAGIDSSLIDTASLAALDGAMTAMPSGGNISLYLTEQETVMELAQRLFLGCNAQAGIGWTGKLFASRLSIGSPAVTLHSQGKRLPAVVDATEADVSPPYKRMQMGGAKSWRVHTLDEIAFQAALTDRGQYLSTTVYREGDIVTLADGSKWVFVGPTPLTGSTPSDANTNWARMSNAIVPVDGSGTPLVTRIAANAAQITLTQADVASLNSQMATIASDSILSRGEKQQVAREYDAIVSMRSALDSMAASMGIASAERSNATSALNALSSYLGSLSPAWNDTSQNTVISASTFTTRWSDAYTAVAALSAAVTGTVGAPTGTPVGTISAGDVSGTIKSGGGLNTNQVDTASVQNNAISDVVGAFTDGTVASTSAETVAQSASVVVGSTGSVIVLMSCLWSGSNSAPSMIYGGLIRLYRNGSMLREWTGMGGGNGFQGNFSSSLVDAPGSGTHGYELRILNLAGGTAQFDASKRSLGLVYQKK